jgi:hypothetical protein
MIISFGHTWQTLVHLVPWTLGTLVFDAFTAATFAGWTGGGTDLAAFLALFMLPFNVIAVRSWAELVTQRRDRRSVAGAGRPKHTPKQWEVTLPPSGTFGFGLSLFVPPILGVFALIFAFRGIPPWWGSLAVLIVVGGLALWVRRAWGFCPVVVIDEKERTVTFRTVRGERGETVLWSAVKTIDVVERTNYDSEDNVTTVIGYEVRIKLEGKGGTRFVDLSGRPEREPVEQFVRWLWERIRPNDKGNSPTAPRVN